MTNSKYPERRNRPVIYSDFSKIPPQCDDLEKTVLGVFINQYYLIAKYPYLKPECFYRESHQKIFKAMVDLYDKDCRPDLLILQDHLRSINELESVGGPVYLTQLTSMEVPDISTHAKIIYDRYMSRELIRISSECQHDAFDTSKDPLEIIEYLQNSLMTLTEFDGDVQNNFNKSLERTITNIDTASKGETNTVLKTGFKRFDKKFTLRTRFVCLIAASEGSGKTKFVTSLARGMLDNEPTLAIQWFTFEDDKEAIIRSFLSMDVKKTSRELQSIDYKMTDIDKEQIRKISKQYEKYTIEFYDRATSMGNILSRSKRFSDKYRNKKRLVIIDNLGLIECDKFGNDRDDFLAAKIKSIADTNDNAVIIIHHLTKEVDRKANITDGYRVRKEFVRGSTRIVDYVQQALYINLLRKHPDLITEEKHLSLDFIGNNPIEFTEANFDKYLWSLNSMPDKDTKSITDLRVETFMKLKSLLNNDTKFASNNKVITFADIIQKYAEYNSYVDTRNKGREEKFKTAKSSIYMFIVRKEFNANYVTDTNTPRSLYLYGKHPNLKHHIDDLFILESGKYRDGDNLDENALFRFVIDLGYNIFKEINEDGSFDPI